VGRRHGADDAEISTVRPDGFMFRPRVPRVWGRREGNTAVDPAAAVLEAELGHEGVVDRAAQSTRVLPMSMRQEPRRLSQPRLSVVS
jgi:hypothetical protein